MANLLQLTEEFQRFAQSGALSNPPVLPELLAWELIAEARAKAINDAMYINGSVADGAWYQTFVIKKNLQTNPQPSGGGSNVCYIKFESPSPLIGTGTGMRSLVREVSAGTARRISLSPVESVISAGRIIRLFQGKVNIYCYEAGYFHIWTQTANQITVSAVLNSPHLAPNFSPETEYPISSSLLAPMRDAFLRSYSAIALNRPDPNLNNNATIPIEPPK